MSRNPRNPQAGRRLTLARHRALQALYQWEATGHSPGEIELQFLPEEPDEVPAEPPAVEPDTELEDATDMASVDKGLFRELLYGVLDRLEDWDAQIVPHLDRAMQSLDPVERVILRMGTFELNERLQVPYRVVINEYVELAKLFGGEDGFKYINGVLDKVARGNRFRAAEMKTRNR
ncbi:MAG: transcription antitermination factor NusB [Ectothiorhodospiraceae bacterium]|nr:transcription antitermination factor NusB [Ectothiorhodospiraceae bacterium]MCH8505687.1 transcription antitermination factor NusB [Ectothiorhodospiraceae bacterium]